VLLAAQGMDVPQIAKVTFSSEDRVRDVLHNFNRDGFDSLYPRYAGGRRRSSPCRNATRSRRWR
jgi:transposase